MSSTSTTSSAEAPVRRGGFRPELHGLRGVAIALVVIYHVWLGRVSGGVDVFLFISAFLLTGTFLRRIDRDEPLQPLAYWARTFKRLLPPAALIVLTTLAATRLFLPPSMWRPTMNDGLASMLQVENWILIIRGTDYKAAMDVGKSPLQHFWSLSIQGQVFLIWPLLFAAAAAAARLTRIRPRLALLILFCTVTAASFTWSVHSTATQQSIAYFDTLTRIWEFAAGSLLALLVARTPPGKRRASTPSARRLRVLAGWAGLLILIGTGAVIDVQSIFPGWVAAVPLAGAALVMAAGISGSPLGADRLLSTRPFAFIGDISYALYLVHWPLLTVVQITTGTHRLGLATGAMVITASVAAAYLLTRLVDTPVRRWTWANARPFRSAAVAATALAIGVAPILTAQSALDRAEAEAALKAHMNNPGGRVLDPNYTPHPDADPAAAAIPSGANLNNDWATIHVTGECEGDLAPQDPALDQFCTVSAPSDQAENDPAVGSMPEAKILVAVGNSRLAQSAMALVDPAERHEWTLVLIRKQSCPFTPEVEPYSGPECDQHNQAALEYIEQIQPDAVALNTTFLPRKGEERVSPAFDTTIPSLLDSGITVIALRDPPRTPEDPVACLEGADSPDDCTQPLDQSLMPPQRPDTAALEELTDAGPIHPIDLTPAICPDRMCPPIIGNVHVMFDEHHATSVYMRSLGDEVERQLDGTGFTW